MNTVKGFLTLFAWIFLTAAAQVAVAQDQENGKITGHLHDQNKEAISFANVALWEANENQLLGGTTSDTEGNFSLVPKKSGSYYLKITAIGYQDHQTQVFQWKRGERLDMGKLSINEDIKSLDEITVKATKPQIIVEADKTIVQVEGTVIAEGNTALEVLARSPGVFIDDDGNIRLNGRDGVMVMIDDRQTYLSAKDLANLLQSMPAENLKSIEVITNPSARFDAEGTGGILNLRLKKNSIEGLNGNVHSGAFYNGIFGAQAGASLNYKKERWTLNNSINYREYAQPVELIIQRNFETPEGTQLFDQFTDATFGGKGLMYTGGVDYDLNDKHSVGVNIQANQFRNEQIADSRTNIFLIGNGLSPDQVTSLNEGDDINRRLFTNFHYVGKLDSSGTRLTADLDLAGVNVDGQSFMTNNFSLSNQTSQPAADQVRTVNPVQYRIGTFKMDLVKPFGEGKSIESGIKGSWVQSDNNLVMEQLVENQWVYDVNRSNHFIYDESILAAYLNLKMPLSKKLALQAGLRSEYTHSVGNSLTLEEVTERNYLDFFPSAVVSHNISSNYQINYSANRRIRRPNYFLLNPFVMFIDPYTLLTGNPNLTPMYSNNFEISQVFHQSYQISIGYSLVTDIFTEFPFQDDETRTTLLRNENLDQMQSYHIRMVAPMSITSWWTSNNTAQIGYTRFQAVVGEGVLDLDQITPYLQSQQTFILPKGFKLEISGIYQGPQVFGTMELNALAWVDTGIKKSFMDDKLSMTLNFTDVFRSRLQRGDMQFTNIDSQFSQYNGAQSLRLSLSYRFSKGEKFQVQNRSGSSDEQNRIN